MKFVNETTLISQGVIIHKNVRNAGILLKTPDGLAIKCFKSKGFILSLIRCLCACTKAHKQWSSAQRLLQLNLKTPQPLEVKLFQPGNEHESAYIYKYLEDAVPFQNAVKNGDSSSLITSLARELSHLAEHDSLFIDFHLDNVLVDSESNLWWIDPEIKTSRSYTQKRFWSRIIRMHEKCNPGVLNPDQWKLFTHQLNTSLPSRLQNDSL